MNGLHAGDTFDIEVNQGTREAVVLATLGDHMLAEYEMPNGTTALRLYGPGMESKHRDYRPVSYRGVPERWLRALVEQGDTWTAKPQQQGSWRPGKPSQELAKRRGGASIVGRS